MCGEFYPGWFDTWGAPHHLGNAHQYLADLQSMLSSGESFSIYMAHGGTTFGLWSGADRPFKPDTSSYDYDAPISEAGWPQAKFFQTRELFAKYLLPGETLPEPPATNPVISIPPVEIAQCAPVFDNLPDPISAAVPGTMETYDQGHGCLLYRTTVPAGPVAILEAAGIHDFGFVFLDGQRVGVMDRRAAAAKILLPSRDHTATLDILVEAVGHVNFGQEVFDPKGIHAPVKLAGRELTGWQMFKFPLDAPMLAGLKFQNATKTAGPAFWRATITIDHPGDTFLDLHSWGKGVLWVNGHCLGRFWNIGPTQTAYLPGCWLHPGDNEVVILDLLGPEKPEIRGLEMPVLNELHPEKDFLKNRRPEVKLNLASTAPVFTGSFAPGPAAQEIKFPASAPLSGRYFCLQSLNACDGGPFAAVAELDLLGADGKSISHDGWTIAYVDSEERIGEDDSAENAIDGQTASFWHTEWKNASPNHPHELVLDLGKTQIISGFRYVPRPGGDSAPGRIKDYRIYLGDNLISR